MEDFFDYLLGLLLIVLIGVIGLLIYFSFHAPLVAYILAISVLAGSLGGATLFLRGLLRKKQLEDYYPLLQSLTDSCKDVKQVLKTLDRPIRKSFGPLRSKIDKLRKTVRKHIWKLYAIDKTLKKLHQQHDSGFPVQASPVQQPHITHRYYEHVRTIETTKARYLTEIQEALQCLYTLHAQLLAMRYAPHHTDMAQSISETLDEVLVTMEALQEIE